MRIEDRAAPWEKDKIEIKPCMGEIKARRDACAPSGITHLGSGYAGLACLHLKFSGIGNTDRNVCAAFFFKSTFV
jgi:hypothetical protein